jgi:hypothetical protein
VSGLAERVAKRIVEEERRYARGLTAALRVPCKCRCRACEAQRRMAAIVIEEMALRLDHLQSEALK